MTMLDRKTSALVLVDYQARLMPAIEHAEAVIRNGVFLAKVAHALDVPVLGTEENPAGLGSTVEPVRSLCPRIISKLRFDTSDDGLTEALRTARSNIGQVVLAGCEAHVCLLQTALGLRRDGFAVFVVPGACGSRHADDKALAMQRLAQNGVDLVSCEMVAFEWLESCADPQFRDVLQLVKQLRA